MEEIEKIKRQLEQLLDDNATKEQIEKVAEITNLVQIVSDKSSKQNDEYKDLLHDYATVVKHQAFTVNNKNMVDDGPKQFSFENCLEKFVANKNNN